MKIGKHMKHLIDKILSHQRLELSELEEVFSKMFSGSLSPVQLSAILCGLRAQGESGRELYAGAKTMREAAALVKLDPSLRPLIDNCGTGGDGSHSFNISTAAAIVAASCGVKVAKHGNRSVSSKCGSADLLFAAGLPDTLTPEGTIELLKQTGFTFFFAPHFHPVMKHVMPVRKELGVRTIFNFLGPLANPIQPEFQLIGVGMKDILMPMAEALKALGTQKALVVHSRDGLDEISSAAVTDAVHLDSGHLTEIEIDPSPIWNIRVT